MHSLMSVKDSYLTGSVCFNQYYIIWCVWVDELIDSSNDYMVYWIINRMGIAHVSQVCLSYRYSSIFRPHGPHAKLQDDIYSDVVWHHEEDDHTGYSLALIP